LAAISLMLLKKKSFNLSVIDLYVYYIIIILYYQFKNQVFSSWLGIMRSADIGILEVTNILDGIYFGNPFL